MRQEKTKPVTRGTLNQRNSTPSKAFTLIELLATIAVIGVLVALLLPSIGRAKGRAYQVACLNHFQQLTSCWQMYSDDNNGKLVSVGYRFKSTGWVNTNAWVLGSMNDDQTIYPAIEAGILDSTNLNGIKWGGLYHYASSVDIYHCPMDISSVGGVCRVRSYSINGWMGGLTVSGQHEFRVFKTQAEIIKPNPSSAWVFIDEHERSINDGWFAVDMVGSKGGLMDAPATRHGNSYALSFADGHVEVWKLTDPRTIHWTALPISNNPTNNDWVRLRDHTTSLL